IGFVLLRQIVAALDELHNRVAEDDSLPSDLHVALRPDALNLCDDGQCQILQFSLIPPPSITRSIIYSGEQSYAMYAAPEQCVAGPIPDFRADFFTLGMLGFELLTSKSLFCLESGEMKMSLVNRRKIRCLHPLLSDVDPDLEKYDDAVIGLLQPLPELRTGQLDTFRSSITDAIAHGDVMAGTSDVCAFITEMQNLERAETLRESVSDSSSKPSMMSTIAQYNAS
ncbi:MAG: hypothetical protein OEQ39_12065, partial [Gammaproteobacteria bacterium]|nr:hypothetical protein [Gammaproteobacteria bacterium]